MTPEQKLIALMSVQTPKQPDPTFEFAVLERVARRRAVERFTRLAMAVVVAGGVFTALVWGALQGEAVQTLSGVAAAVGSAAIAGLVVWTLRRAG